MNKSLIRMLSVLFALLTLAFPTCCEEASAPDIQTLSAIACSAAADGGTVDLYCGPTQGFYRHAEQTLDPGQPYVYFGQFDCWSMVAQGTPDAFGPVGWVETALLDTLPDAPELSFDDAFAAMVEETAPLTNDPLTSDSSVSWLHTLARGEEVIILAQYSDWLYVQTEIETLPARVFVPSAAIL